MVNKFTAQLEVSTFEFMLDLPTTISVVGAEVKDGLVILSCETEAEVAGETLNLIYNSDETGFTALTDMVSAP